MHASEMETNYSMVLCFTVLLLTIMIIISDAHDCSTTIERFRLHNTTASSGIVQALSQQGSQQGWFPICVFGGIWHFSPASEVLCRQLGYEGLTESVDYIFPLPVEDPVVLLHWIDCRGDEEQVSDCEVDIDEHVVHLRSCRGVEVVCTACTLSIMWSIWEVRLSGGLIPEQGNVEMCIGGRWTGICGRNWDYKDAFVVCRQLGLPATDADSYSNSISFFGEHKFPSNVSFKCVGNESHLTDCLNSSVSRYSTDVAGVYCKGEIVTATGCTDGNIRLAGGQDQNEGRVEVCSGGLWGTVYDWNWDINDAEVACRQLGYGSLSRTTIIKGSNAQRLFGSGNGPIPLAGLSCIGNETSLFDCPTYSYVYSATIHSRDIGLKCQPIPPTAIGCSQGSVRLRGGDTQYEGRVEICIDGVWGSVSDFHWDIINAAIVCHQLGFGRDNVSAVFGSHYGEGEGLYHLSGVNCRGHENTLLECRNSNIVLNGIPGHDAGVRCELPSPPCNHGDVRLYAGYTDQDGIAEVCINGTWGAFCDDYFGTLEATIFCRQLTGRSNVLPHYSSCCSRLSYTGNVTLTRLTCSGNEDRIVDCSYGLVHQGSSDGCNLSEDITVGCYVPSGCTRNGDVQVLNGSTTFEGRVEICIDGIWRAVTSSSWDTNDAEVVCRQLGYPWEWALSVPFGTFGRGNAPFGVHGTQCTGNEVRLIDCRYTSSSISQAWRYRTRYKAAGVICQGSAGNQTQCDTGAVRLVNGQQKMEGRVEICASGTWATVCDSNWGVQETHTVCRQLGYPTGGSYHLTGSWFGRKTAIPILGEMACSDQASGIIDCRVNYQTGSRYCHHGKNVGVVCRERVHYNISIKKSEDSYELGSQVTLNCTIRPLPVDNRTQITYEWSSSASQSGSISFSPQMSNATVTIHNNHPAEALYYCRVYRNGALLGTGRIMIRVRGLIHTISPSMIQAVPQDTIMLQVNTTDIEVKDYLRELAWYHNGRRVVSSGRVILSRGNKTLTIASATETDNGVYEAKFEGLLVYPYNQLCEELTVSLLRYYPILSPVLFYVNSEGPLPHASTAYSATTNSGAGLETFPNSFTEFDDVSMAAYLAKSNLRSEEYLLERASLWWYVNGIRLPVYRTAALDTIQYNGLVYLSQELILNSIGFQDSGTYETLLIVDVLSVSRGCDDYYNGFVTLSTRFGNRYVAVSKSTTDLPYYEMLSFELEVDKSAITWEESATITCSASIKYPPLDSITLIKNGVHVATSSEGKIQVNSASLGVHPFGEYVCVVDASGIRFQKEITIEEQGFLQVEAAIDSSLFKCSTTEASVSMVTESVVSKIRADCFCNITSEAFINSSITCTNDKLIFSTTVTFSTDDGRETASTVVDRIVNQASYSSFPLVLNGTTALVTSACSKDCEPKLSSVSSDSISSAAAGSYFVGGLFAGAILVAVVAVIVLVTVLMKRKKNVKLQSDGSSQAPNEDRYTRRGTNNKVVKPSSQTSDGKPRGKKAPLMPPQASYMEMNAAYQVHSQGKSFEPKPYEEVHHGEPHHGEGGEAIYEETFNF